MKKTTVISLSVILFSLCTLQSCRQDEMDVTPENSSLIQKEQQQKVLLQSANDTIGATSNIGFDENGNELADPPPRDKDQWKH